MALLYPVYILTTYLNGPPVSLQNIILSLSIATLIFIVCIGFFALNMMGGGDVKLIPAVALWAGSAYVLNYLLITAVVGGLAAVILLAKNRIKASKFDKSSENINLSMSEKKENGVPYGVGIAIGGLYVAYHLLTPFSLRFAEQGLYK